MLNGGGISFGVFEDPLNDYKGFAVSRIIHDFYEHDPQKLGFYGGGGIDARFDLTPIGFAMGALPPGSPRWGKGFKDVLAHNFTRTLEVLSHGTSLPLENNSFSLDPDVKDAWGLPALRMTYKDHPDDLKLRLAERTGWNCSMRPARRRNGPSRSKSNRSPCIFWAPAAWATIPRLPSSTRTIGRTM